MKAQSGGERNYVKEASLVCSKPYCLMKGSQPQREWIRSFNFNKGDNGKEQAIDDDFLPVIEYSFIS